MSSIQLGTRDKDGFISMPTEEAEASRPQSTLSRIAHSRWLWSVAGVFAFVALVAIGSHPELVPRWAGLRSTAPRGPLVKVELPALNNSRAAVMIEKEAKPSLIPVLLNFISIVPPEWPFIVYTGEESHELLDSARLIAPHIKSGKLTLKSLPDEDEIYDSSTLSSFLARNSDFWNSLPAEAETLLTFDANSIACANSQQSLNDFLGFDKFPGGYSWMATPWGFKGYPVEPDGGNGGFAIRRKSVMIKTTTEHDYDSAPEDLWFAARIKQSSEPFFPSGEDGLRFVFENPPQAAKSESFVYAPFGVHAGGTCDDGDIKKLLEYCPEAQIVIENKCLND